MDLPKSAPEHVVHMQARCRICEDTCEGYTGPTEDGGRNTIFSLADNLAVMMDHHMVDAHGHESDFGKDDHPLKMLKDTNKGAK